MARQQEKDPRCRQCGHRDGIGCGKTAAYFKSLVEGQDAHGWMTAAPLRAMKDLRHATFETFGKHVQFLAMPPQGSVDARTLWHNTTKQM